MTRRPRRVIPASLLALAVLAVCAITAATVIQGLAGQAPLFPVGSLARHARTLRLDGAVMVSAGAVTAALGLALLGCALYPGRAETLALAAVADEPGDGQPGRGARSVAGVSRSGLRAALAASLADVEGVSGVRIRVRSRRVTARVRTELTATATLRACVRRVAEQRLGEAGLARQPEVRVSVLVRGRAAP